MACFLAVAMGYDDEYTEPSRSLRKKRSLLQQMKVVYIEAPPYIFKKDDNTFEGFIPDLIDTISKRLRFHYSEYLVPDGKYGTKDKDGNWVGMIGEVLKHEMDKNAGADIAAAPLTMTSARLDVVDFLQPFQHTGLALLVKKPYLDNKPRDFIPFVFQVLDPFASEVWALTIAGFLVVAGLLWGFNYANPYEWGPRFQMGRATETQGNLFNLQGALWYAFSTLQWQGYERAPRSIAARVLSCFWFAFVTLTLATYTGSLMNHLFWASTVHGKDLRAPPFHTLEEMLMNKEYSYGLIEGGSTYRFIKENDRQKEYMEMERYLHSEEGKKNLLKSTAEGIKRVREGKFAFVMEDMSARHAANEAPCDLMVAGEKFAPRSYGMAVSKHMDRNMSDMLHQAILELHEEGEIEALERKWWIDRGECWNVTHIETASRINSFELNKPKQVTMHEFWGPLVLLVVGVIISILLAVAEIGYYRYRGRYHAGNSRERPPLKLDDDFET